MERNIRLIYMKVDGVRVRVGLEGGTGVFQRVWPWV
jgi:hypothetical protein